MLALVIVFMCLAVIFLLSGGGLSSRPGVIQRRRNRKDCQHWSREGRAGSQTMRCIACGHKSR